MSEIFIARPGSLRDVDKAALRKAGIVVVEANHEDVKFIRTTMEVDASEMLNCALKALNVIDNYSSGSKQREAFTRLMSEVMASHMSKKEQP